MDESEGFMQRMIEVKTAELDGAALDWAVAKATEWLEPFYGIGRIWADESGDLFMDSPDPDEPNDVTELHHFNHIEAWSPRRIWSQGGRLIEKFGVNLMTCMDKSWQAKIWVDGVQVCLQRHKHEPLIAACRAIVSAKLGDTVSVPAELVS